MRMFVCKCITFFSVAFAVAAVPRTSSISLEDPSNPPYYLFAAFAAVEVAAVASIYSPAVVVVVVPAAVKLLSRHPIGPLQRAQTAQHIPAPMYTQLPPTAAHLPTPRQRSALTASLASLESLASLAS